MSDPTKLDSVCFSPIAVVRSPFREKAEAPRQPSAARGVEGSVEFLRDPRFEDALDGMEAWSHVWLLFHFHLAGDFRPKVLPPRSDVRRGVLSTRSPHRPNPIGLSLVRIVAREPYRLKVSDIDLVDGTPILDIKPYVGYTDSASDASSGWIEIPDPKPEYRVEWSDLADAQARFVQAQGSLDLKGRVETTLRLGPAPHAYRRIREDERGSVLATKSWRVRFTHAEGVIHVSSIESGHRPSDLARGQTVDHLLHRAFVEAFGGSDR